MSSDWRRQIFGCQWGRPVDLVQQVRGLQVRVKLHFWQLPFGHNRWGSLHVSMSQMIMSVVDKLAIEQSKMPVQDGAPTLSHLLLAHTYYLLTTNIVAKKESCQMLWDPHRQANEEYVPPPPPPPVDSITSDSNLICQTQDSIFKVCFNHFELRLETLPSEITTWMSSQSCSSGSQCSSEEESLLPLAMPRHPIIPSTLPSRCLPKDSLWSA